MGQRSSPSSKGARRWLGEGETIRETWSANHTRGHLAIGGRLWLTSHRLIFIPNWFERRLQRQPWECHLQTVSEVSAAPRGAHPWSGAWRRRLAIRHGDDDLLDLFVANQVETVARIISEAAASPE